MEGIDLKVEWDKFQLQTYWFNAAKHSEDNCQICQVAKWTPIGKKNINPNWKPKVASNGEKESTPSKKKIPKKFVLVASRKLVRESLITAHPIVQRKIFLTWLHSSQLPDRSRYYRRALRT